MCHFSHFANKSVAPLLNMVCLLSKESQPFKPTLKPIRPCTQLKATNGRSEYRVLPPGLSLPSLQAGWRGS